MKNIFMKIILMILLMTITSFSQIRDSIVYIPGETINRDTTVIIITNDTLNVCAGDTIRIVYIQLLPTIAWNYIYIEIPRDTICEPIIIDSTYVPPDPTSGNNYYMDKDANGNNTGTSWINAWISFNNIDWGIIQPGDIIYISGGTDSTIYYETLEIGNVQGTAANPITVIAGKYAPNPSGHSGRVIIDGGNYPNPGSRVWNIYLGHDGGLPWGPEYITIKGLESRGALNGAELEGKGNVIVFDSLTIYHWWDLAGILARGDGYDNTFSGIDSTIVKNCTIISDVNWGVQTDGIYIGGATNTIIHNNYVRMRSQDEYAHVDCIQSIYSQGFEIYNNVLINDSVYSPEGGGMPIILRNGDISGDGLPVIIYNNFCYMGGIWQIGANQGYVFNTHVGDNWAGKSPTYLFHNTIIGNGPQLAGTSLEYFGKYDDGVFLNNIVALFGDGTANRWTFGCNNGYVDSIRHNLVWNAYNDQQLFISNSWSYNWTGWINAGGTGVNANPLFVDNIGYEPDQGAIRGDLQSNSPAINQGEDLTYLINYLYNTYGKIIEWKDIYGNPRDNTPTIGAYE